MKKANIFLERTRPHRISLKGFVLNLDSRFFMCITLTFQERALLVLSGEVGGVSAS